VWPFVAALAEGGCKPPDVGENLGGLPGSVRFVNACHGVVEKSDFMFLLTGFSHPGGQPRLGRTGRSDHSGLGVFVEALPGLDA
jgi:hypothetical protein